MKTFALVIVSAALLGACSNTAARGPEVNPAAVATVVSTGGIAAAPIIARPVYDEHVKDYCRATGKCS